MKKIIPADLEHLRDGLYFVEELMKKYQYDHKMIQEALMITEDALLNLIEHVDQSMYVDELGNPIEPGEDYEYTDYPMVVIRFKSNSGYATIKLSAPGVAIDLSNMQDVSLDEVSVHRDIDSAIRGMLYTAFEDKILYSRKGNYNCVKITAGSPQFSLGVHSIIAFVIALLLGMFLNFFIKEANYNMLNDYLFNPIQQMFLNILLLISGPTMFLSIVTNVSRLFAFSNPGRIGTKVIGGYIFTSIVAIVAGVVLFGFVDPGTAGAYAEYATNAIGNVDVGAQKAVSVITNIIPTNIISPFLNVNSLQIIFLALLCGITLGHTSNYSNMLRGLFEALNMFMSKVTTTLMKFTPIAVFASVMSMTTVDGNYSVVLMFELVGLLLLGILVLVFIYMGLISVIGRLNPIPFVKKYIPFMRETFMLGSEIAAVPKNMRFCKKKLGISSKVCSFSIPFGAMMNMDANCIYLTIASLFMAKLCGIEYLNTSKIFFVLVILVLSIGAPISAGSVLICMTMLMTQMGVSLEAMSILLGINVIMDMILAVSNCIGDVAISIIVASYEGVIDKNIYLSK